MPGEHFPQVFDVQIGVLAKHQTYLKLASMGEMDKETREEHEQIWEHVKTLRRRIAALN